MKHYLVRYKPVIEADANMFTAECKELRFMGSGYSQEEALHRLGNSIRAYLAALQRGKWRNSLEEVLQQVGLQYEILDEPDEVMVILS